MLAYSPGNSRRVTLTIAVPRHIIITKRDRIVTGETNSPAIVDDICYRLEIWKLDQTAIEILNGSTTTWCIARHRASESRPPKNECHASSHEPYKTFGSHRALRRKIP